MAAKNLKISTTQIVGIHKLIPSVYGGPQRLTKIALPVVTHDVHFTRSCLGASGKDIIRPNQDVGLLIGFSAASAIGRPSGSKALIYDDKLYYRMSHSDLYGRSNPSTPASKIEGRLVQFLRLETDQTIIDRVFVEVGALIR